MRNLTVKDIDDIIYIYHLRQSLSEEERIYFDWYVDYKTFGQN